MPRIAVGSSGTTRRGSALHRDQKINANFFWTKFFDNPSGHGRPRRKSWTSAPKRAFSCGPGDGRNFLFPGHPGVRVRNVRGKSGPKSLCLCCFSSLTSACSETAWKEARPASVGVCKKEWRRQRRAGKRSSKTRERTARCSQLILRFSDRFHGCFPARRLLRSLGAF